LPTIIGGGSDAQVFERSEMGGEPHLMDIRSVMSPTLTTNFGAESSGQPMSLNSWGVRSANALRAAMARRHATKAAIAAATLLDTAPGAQGFDAWVFA
jgi:hypothetical protein